MNNKDSRADNFKSFCLLQGTQKNQLRETLMEVGFTFFLILARMQDIDPLMSTSKSDVIFFIIACTFNMSTTL